MESITLKLPDITCDGWVLSIRMAVGRKKGFGKINGDGKSQTLTLEYDPSILTVETIQDALNEIGYESTLAD